MAIPRPSKKLPILLSGEFSIEFEVFEEIALGLVSAELHDGLGWHTLKELERAKCSTAGMG